MNDFKSRVDKIVSESEDMLTALESIGPMYGIPATNMLESPEVTSLKVVNDHIITPCDVKPNAKAIMCAIGAVLDHISQRVDEKLNDYQNTTIQKNKLDEHIRRDSNPAKGTVIGRYEDSNGDEILVYDSGLVDMANTKEAQQKVAELRQDMKIPMYTPTAMTAAKYSYFSDEDDITVEEPKPMKFEESAVTDIADAIGESRQIMDWIAHYHDTTHLGYDMLQEQGFDFVKMTDTFIQEASNKKELTSKDIKHMKFDNKHIMNAIKYFNAARAEQSEAGKGEWDIEKFINSPNYSKAIDELNAQFDCKLNIRWFKDETKPDSTQLCTPMLDDIRQNITVSKSKGFQLHGLAIDIFVVNKAIDEEMTKTTNNKLFGQFVCAGLCHEIFHNIVNAIRYKTATFNFTISSAISLASSSGSAKTRRLIFEKFVKSCESKGVKIPLIQKKKLVKDLCKLSAISYNKQLLNDIKGKLGSVDPSAAANSAIDDYIKKLQSYGKIADKMQKKHDRIKRNEGLYKVLTVIGFLLTLTGIGAIIGIPMITLSTDPLEGFEEYLNSTNKEEFYCDLFAATYNLPLSFTIGDHKRDFTINQISDDRIQKMVNLEKKISTFSKSTYPTLSERNYAAMTIAKNILDSGDKIEPELKEYCEWVVANYSKILDTDIATNYQTVTFNPEEAKDLDAHVQNLIDNNDLAVTEWGVL